MKSISNMIWSHYQSILIHALRVSQGKEDGLPSIVSLNVVVVMELHAMQRQHTG